MSSFGFDSGLSEDQSPPALPARGLAPVPDRVARQARATARPHRTGRPGWDGRWRGLLAAGVLLLAACGVATEPAETPPPAPTATALPDPVVIQQPASTATPLPTVAPVPTATTSPTPDPYAEWTIDHLEARSYGDGPLEVIEVLGANEAFTRTLITYPSDDLTIHGFMNVPRQGEGPFPVIIALHGYIDPEAYNTLDYTTRYADSLAQSGYLVLHPNLRGYPPSDPGSNLFRVGMAVDVLNLLSIVRAQGDMPGPLQRADPERIGLWGHSMGGGISIRVMTVDPEVDAVLLYGSMSGDEARNFTKILEWSEGERGLEELAFPQEQLARVSPIFHLDRVRAPVSVHHGEADALVPLAWSLELCDRLGELEKSVECVTYPGQPHTFYGEGDLMLMQRAVEFFDRHLKD